MGFGDVQKHPSVDFDILEEQGRALKLHTDWQIHGDVEGDLRGDDERPPSVMGILLEHRKHCASNWATAPLSTSPRSSPSSSPVTRPITDPGPLINASRDGKIGTVSALLEGAACC